MKRVNLVEYFELAEELRDAYDAANATSAVAGRIWVSVYPLPEKLRSFAQQDNGFSATKHVALDLADHIRKWITDYIMSGDSPDNISSEKMDAQLSNWQYSSIATKIDAFKSVFRAECRDLDVYSVGQIAIHKTSDLVSRASVMLPAATRNAVPFGVAVEFDDAGKCLAFGLPTACGFHALRGLELVIEGYLRAFGVTATLHSWNDYVKAAKALADGEGDKKPAPKVASMIDRMRELDRNPLMHPRDTLDEEGADMLFRLATITVYEIVKDMKANGRSMQEPENDSAPAPNSLAPLFVEGPKKGEAA